MKTGYRRQPGKSVFHHMMAALFGMGAGVRAPEESNVSKPPRRINRSRHSPHQGHQEKARRRRQMERGLLAFAPVKGVFA